MPNCKLYIRVDSIQVLADLEVLAKASAHSLELRQRLLDFGIPGTHLISLDDDPAFPPVAKELGIHLELSNGLAQLVSAVRAGQFD